MKLILFLLILCNSLFIELLAQEGISIIKVQEVYTLSEVNYTGEKTITLKLNSGLIIKATPINPPELDGIFYEKSLANGQLEYREYKQSKEDYFIKKKKKKQKEEKTNSEMLFELADILLEENKITEEQYNTLVSAVQSRNASNEQVVSSNLPLLINPFYLNKKYLSVFQLTIENPTTAPILFDETISIHLGNNLYTRYLTQEVLDLYKYDNINNYAKITLLLNENLPEKIEIPAGVTFSKYICTAPIKYNEGPLTLIISSPKSSAKATWNIDLLNNEIEKTYTYNGFDFYITSNSGVDFRESTIADGVLISLTKESDFFLLSDKLYVNQDDLDKVIEFVVLYIYMDNAYFAVAQITPKTYVNVSKQRLEDIEIETDKTDRVKRKLE